MPDWTAGSATGVGSLPGTDPAEAVRTVFGELGQFPFLPELPNRGPGAEMIGRAGSLLVAMPIEIVPSGWRLTPHPGPDMRRAQDFLSRDLDALELVAASHHGPVKVQVCGPWTLAASMELPSGHRIVTDHGATRDVIASLAEGVRMHLQDLSMRLPHAQIVLQIDEPYLAAVLAGTVPTPSGYGTVRAIDANVVSSGLRDVLSAAPQGARIIHSCASDVPIALLRESDADALSLDITSNSWMSAERLDALGEAVDAGVRLLLGIVPSLDSALSTTERAEKIKHLWNVLGYPLGQLASVVVPTTSCGLAGASADYARNALKVTREIGEELLQVN